MTDVGKDKDASLVAAVPNFNPGEEYWTENREPFQGIPGIEKTEQGRLFCTYYSGGDDEGPDNYVLLIQSEDDGKTWSRPRLVVDPPGKVRAFDPVVWIDPRQRLWLFWAQSYTKFDGRCGVWFIRCDNPDAEQLQWTEPRWIANGIMMNKPTVVSDNQWLFPTAIWADHVFATELNDIPQEKYSNVVISRDQGENFEFLGSADIPNRWFDEHMLVQKQDGRLWMLVRTVDGVGQSFSEDGGRTWGPASDTGWGGPNSRFFIRRLQSGNLLLVNHVGFTGRSHLTALLSEDDGATWPHKLLLDERTKVSYPDGVQDREGAIYITYDRDRRGDRDILMTKFWEEDIRQGAFVSKGSKEKWIIDSAR